MKTNILFYLVKNISLLKSLRFNFKYFPIREAWKFPALIFKHTVFASLEGKIKCNCKTFPGMLIIGSCGVNAIDIRQKNTIIELKGELILNGRTVIGRGSSISVGKNANVQFGANFNSTGNNAIISVSKITFGDNCQLSWDILIMDTDFHPIYSTKGDRINHSKPIIFGNNVWIGCKCTILKGVEIGNNVVIAAGTQITRKKDGQDYSNAIIADCNEVKVVKGIGSWSATACFD